MVGIGVLWSVQRLPLESRDGRRVGGSYRKVAASKDMNTVAEDLSLGNDL
jgi:hypothetical protein